MLYNVMHVPNNNMFDAIIFKIMCIKADFLLNFSELKYIQVICYFRVWLSWSQPLYSWPSLTVPAWCTLVSLCLLLVSGISPSPLVFKSLSSEHATSFCQICFTSIFIVFEKECFIYVRSTLSWIIWNGSIPLHLWE